MNQIEILQYRLLELSISEIIEIGFVVHEYKWDILGTETISHPGSNMWNWYASFSFREFKEESNVDIARAVLRLQFLILNNDNLPKEEIANECIKKAAIKLGEIFNLATSEPLFNIMPPHDSDIWMSSAE